MNEQEALEMKLVIAMAALIEIAGNTPNLWSTDIAQNALDEIKAVKAHE